jgi:hypothetical protein
LDATLWLQVKEDVTGVRNIEEEILVSGQTQDDISIYLMFIEG